MAGVGALVSAAVIFHLVSNKTSPVQQVFEDIDSLGPPKKEMNGMLSFGYYKDIFSLIQKASKAKFAGEKKQLLENRRRLLRENKLAEYKELAKDLV